MKKTAFLLLVFIVSYSSYAQDTVVAFYNNAWEKTDKERATYIRDAFLDSGLWSVKDYYLKTGTLEKIGQYKSIDEDLKHGSFVFYFENGNKKSQGDYYKNYKINVWQSWYDEGTVRSKENFVSDTTIIDKILVNGIISVGYNLDIGTYFVSNFGIFKGVSEWFYPNGQISAYEEWGNGLLSIKHWDEKGKKINVDKQRPIKEVINKPPLPKKDFGRLMDKRKSEYKNTKLKGRVIVKFVVDTDGTVVDSKIFSSSGIPELDDEAIKIVNSMSGAWDSGRCHNLPEKSELFLPITSD